MLTRASRARIEKDGYVLNINISERNGVPSPGVYREAGKCGNLPSGEAYIAPLEDGSDGEMIIDGSMASHDDFRRKTTFRNRREERKS